MTNEALVGGEVKAAANYVAGTAEYLMGAGPAVVTVVACIGLGYLLKALPFPNRYIPPVIWITGAMLYPLLAPVGTAPNNVRSPALLFAIVGLVMGFSAWVIHRAFLRKFLDEKWFKPDDTIIVEKTTTIHKHNPKLNEDDTLT